MNLIQLGWLDHAIAVALLAIMGSALLRRNELEENAASYDTPLRINTYLSGSIFLWVVAAATTGVWLLQGRAIGDLGFRYPFAENASLTIVLLAVFVTALAFDTMLSFWNAERKAESARRYRVITPFMPRTKYELAWWTVLAASAGVCEEIVFRGYLIQYFLGLFGSSPFASAVAVGLPAVVFGISHVYQGTAAVLKIFGLSLLFGGIFVASNSIVALIIVHYLLDVLQGVLGLLFFSNPTKPNS